MALNTKKYCGYMRWIITSNNAPFFIRPRLGPTAIATVGSLSVAAYLQSLRLRRARSQPSMQ